jgi:hypothetical protein
MPHHSLPAKPSRKGDRSIKVTAQPVRLKGRTSGRRVKRGR